MTHPTLYKKTSTGAIQFWTISTKGNDIVTEYGQVGTDSPQITVDTIKEGKNAGPRQRDDCRAASRSRGEGKLDEETQEGLR